MDKSTETQGEERGGQAICFSWGERNVCEEQEPPGTLRYSIFAIPSHRLCANPKRHFDKPNKHTNTLDRRDRYPFPSRT